MKNILVSGASGIVGYGILRSLQRSGKPLNLIGTTIYNDSVAQGFCDSFEQAIPTNEGKYIEWLVKTIKKHKVDLLMAGIEADIYKWADHIQDIEATGAKIVLNNIDLTCLCKDKWAFYESLVEGKSPYVIDSSLAPDFNLLSGQFGLPFLLKPRRGFGSKGIVKVDDADSFSKWVKDIGPVLMAQPIVGNEDEEYTTSAFCDGKGGFYCHMTLKRRLSKDGFTDKAEVVEMEGIQTALTALCKLYKPEGPTNFQFRKHDNTLKLLEINPRVSSSTSIRSAFGYNESVMAVEYYLENKIPVQPVIKKGRAVRYVDDFIFYL
jgi:carbamoyl-phosphate synthase large subunit